MTPITRQQAIGNLTARRQLHELVAVQVREDSVRMLKNASASLRDACH